MGPGGHEIPGNLLSAPRLSVSIDKYTYRHEVREWAERICVLDGGGYKKEKGIVNWDMLSISIWTLLLKRKSTDCKKPVNSIQA